MAQAGASRSHVPSDRAPIPPALAPAPASRNSADPKSFCGVCLSASQISRSFMPAAIKPWTVSNSSADRTCAPLTLVPRPTQEGPPTVILVSRAVLSATRGRDETGRHDGFRCHCSKERVGSSPSARTTQLSSRAEIAATVAVRRVPTAVTAISATPLCAPRRTSRRDCRHGCGSTRTHSRHGNLGDAFGRCLLTCPASAPLSFDRRVR